MGLDGISINQLRITPENSSAELNNQVNFNLNSGSRIVNGLTEGQRVNPNKEKEKEKEKSKKSFNSTQEDEEEIEEQQEFQDFDVAKYDLSKNDKYTLKIEDSTNSILIIEKSTKNVIQKISADELTILAKYLSNSQGSIISKRY